MDINIIIVGMQFFMDLLCLYVSFEQGHWCSFFLNYLFKVVCTVNSFGRWRSYLPPEHRTGVFNVQYNKDNISCIKGQASLSIIKDSDSLCSGLLFHNAMHCMHRGHLALSAPFCGNWGSEKWCKNTNILATAIAVSKKLSFISDPGAYSFPSDPWNWQANI